ncbi:MAG TPA: exodeoxyribonuclease V subunit gamma [Gammaproteobacteria bacterium]|nr:exodeoxyribonuclease V subunit gamma [Gammaproteobacteria bacterium]
MFHLYQHHDLSTLASMLAALRERAAPASPLAADTVLVPNRGTARWLQAELAASEGSAANLELPVPGRSVWQARRDTLPGGAGQSAVRTRALVSRSLPGARGITGRRNPWPQSRD